MTETQLLYAYSNYESRESGKYYRAIGANEVFGLTRRAVIIGRRGANRTEVLEEIRNGLNRNFLFINLHKIGPKQSVNQFVKNVMGVDFLELVKEKPNVLFDNIDEDTDKSLVVEVVEFAQSNLKASIFITMSSSFLEANPSFKALRLFDVVDLEPPTKKKDDFNEWLNAFKGEAYAVNSIFGKIDHSETFINEGVWRSSKGRGPTGQLLDEVKVGDILIMKVIVPLITKKVRSTIFRVQAIGVVTSTNEKGTDFGVNWTSYLDRLIDFENELTRFRNRIHRMTKDDLAIIADSLGSIAFTELPLVVEENETQGETRLTAISNDSVATDTLDFKRDIQSLAALIALKEMKAPLAIALFGRWGSGKSFFMKNIEKYVRELSMYQGFRTKASDAPVFMESDENLFHEGVVHIRFNAWSYMDSNLWAGLAHSLFEKLNEYITDFSKGDAERLNIQLKITKRLNVLHSDINNFKVKMDELESMKEQIESHKKNKISKYFHASSYNTAVVNLLEENGVDKETIKKLSPNEIEQQIKTGVGYFNYAKNNKGKVVLIAGAVALIAIVYFVINSFDLIPKFGELWVTSIAAFATIVTPIAKYYNKVKGVKNQVSKFINDIEMPKIGSELDADLDKVKDEIHTLNGYIDDANASIEQEHANGSKVTQFAVENFISAKSGHQDYTKHLGIITTIRKDFETLSELLLEEKPEFDFTEKEKERFEKMGDDRKGIKEDFVEDKNLERIVLYIDDLDRCNDDDKVMEILEAVHLLMAFPLFIVVVGVDERCVHNAISHRRIARYKGIDPALIPISDYSITSREYLEKIFQIPYQLPVATDSGVEAMINSLAPVVIDDVESEQEPNDVLLPPESHSNVHYGDNSAKGSQMNFAEDSSPRYGDLPKGKTKIEEWKEIEASDIVAVAPTAVRITAFDNKYLQLIAPLVGRNPRTIKRFVNIYRIAKAHLNEELDNDESTVRLIFLIAFFIGDNRQLAIEVFEAEDTTGNIRSRIKFFEEWLKRPYFELWYLDDPLMKEVLDSEPSKLAKHLEFVKRFSYRMAVEDNTSISNKE